MFRTNVLVIGGGPAGSIASRFLASNGIDTILIDRDFSYVKPCGGGIPYAAFCELDIPLTTVKKEIRKIIVVSPRGERVEVGLRGGHLCIVKRGEFDKTLRKIASDKGATLLEAEFIGFESTGKKIVSIIQKKENKEQIKIISDYVIASDGVTAKTVSTLGIRKNPSTFTISTHIKNDLISTNGGDDACEFWFGSKHASNFYSWVFPSSEYLSVGTGSSEPRKLLSLLDNFLTMRFNSDLKGLREKTRAFKIPLWTNKIFNVSNILFTGDSAGMVMPVTYEGIYYAMKSAEFASRAILQHKPSAYKKLWSSRFNSRFILMNKIKNYIFKNDENIEKFVLLHKRLDVQEIAMRLWLTKETGASSLISYLKMLTHILK